MTKNNVEGKDLFLSVLHNRSSSKAVKAGIHIGQDPGGRSECRSHGGVLLTGVLLMACSAWWHQTRGATTHNELELPQ